MSDPEEGGPPAPGLRVLTLNLLSPDHADWERRRAVLRDGLRELRPGRPSTPASRATPSPRNPLVRAGEMKLERGRRIDYVMVRCGVHGPTLEVAGCSLAFDRPVGGVWASDHFGVVADLRVPRRPPGSWD